MINQRIVKIFKNGSTTFYNSSLFFDPKIKNDVFTLYAFVRTADDFVDKVPQDKQGIINFINDYRSALKGKSNGNEIIKNFVELKNRTKIKDEWVEAFLKAMLQDISKSSYQTNEETEDYIYGSAAVVGLMMAQILGLSKDSLNFAEQLGRAFQYINFIRDILEDIDLKRSYFPHTEMKKFNITEISKQYLEANPEKFIKFIRFQLDKYKSYLKEGLKGFEYIPKHYRVAIKTATDMYDWTYQVIYNDPSIVLRKKVKPSRVRVLLNGFKNLIFY